jgi:hypothetical protein
VPPNLEPTFQSLQEASAYRAPRNVQLERDTQGLKSRRIEGGSWTDSQFELYLSNSKTLRFDLDGVKVRWSVGPKSQAVASLPVRDVQPVTLELKSGVTKKPRRILWDREGAFRKCIGRRFKKVVAGAACLWLYTEGKSSLLYFSRLVQVTGERDLLYWIEEK